MKNKHLKYFLVAGTLLIWGIIIFRVSNAIQSDEIPAPIVPNNTELRVTAQSEDTFTLFLDYPDPFLRIDSIEDTEISDLTATSKAEKSDLPLNLPTTTSITQQPGTNPPINIKFRGMINNPETKLKMAIISINEKGILAREGTLIDGVTIIKIQKNKIVVKIDSKKMEIPLE